MVKALCAGHTFSWRCMHHRRVLLIAQNGDVCRQILDGSRKKEEKKIKTARKKSSRAGELRNGSEICNMSPWETPRELELWDGYQDFLTLNRTIYHLYATTLDPGTEDTGREKSWKRKQHKTNGARTPYRPIWCHGYTKQVCYELHDLTMESSNVRMRIVAFAVSASPRYLESQEPLQLSRFSLHSLPEFTSRLYKLPGATL